MIYAKEKQCIKINSDFWAMTEEDAVGSPGRHIGAQVLHIEVDSIPQQSCY